MQCGPIRAARMMISLYSASIKLSMAAFERKRQPKAIKGVEIVLLFSTMFDHKSAASATHFALICSKKNGWNDALYDAPLLPNSYM